MISNKANGAHLMKMKVQHIVPLSRQAIEVVRELLATPIESRFLFPVLGHPERPMSENTVRKALRIMGYSAEDMSPHGFRSLASTLLNELGWPPDAIEKQLAHIEEDEVRGAYNYAKYLPMRRKMMQFWADYLHGLRVKARGGRVEPLLLSFDPTDVSLAAEQGATISPAVTNAQ